MPVIEEPIGSDRELYTPLMAKVIEAEHVTKLEKWFKLQWPDGQAQQHTPGQFVQVSMLGIGECPISICSSPTRPDYFEMTVRRVGAVTTAIHTVEAGDSMGIRGPLGRGFDVTQFYGRDIVVIAGGCALAPARSMIQYILDERDKFGEFRVFYGAKTPEDLLFRDELAAWQSRRDVGCHVTVDQATGKWDGSVGVVTSLFHQLPKFDSGNTRAIVIGPPIMFKFVVMELFARGLKQKDIWCSLERHMKCGIGKCGHCLVNHLYGCQSGPVFNLAELANVREAIE